jgi:hypothetical protein
MSVRVRHVGLLLSGAGGEVAGPLGEWCDLSRSQLAGASAEAAFPLAGRQQRGRQQSGRERDHAGGEWVALGLPAHTSAHVTGGVREGFGRGRPDVGHPERPRRVGD